MNNIESSTGEIVMYQPDETIRLEVRVDRVADTAADGRTFLNYETECKFAC